ncbi:MmcQ/YjbR family DNA-binding protein [Verrucomicrobiaceae bacterium R5-34]|uniref:MmcQ/YjbR family DNA-binding protein n=1 Tax=Oceaniferula flava TaxID=2800421 RepID=A0AAE2VBS7_9BACT|nr:MmcQ/YjbR family DNA-binding protein [Oceaniferula flavus]MBK1831573.1 MmcQ/YjbR family DNA-binding protein [Verrucomicrobiaceae bacterium R5-34]MBK1854186.1 MmcQ/YjbR family DNA-binding protein [Oceaniferula flavus]MBM1135492.1 MmcQ/YjbR family DNA-binding protein [Oceaniferula flavus]
MTVADVIDYCSAKKGAVETTPFGPQALVYKVMGKMFALTDPDEYPPFVNLKCDPDRALELRDEHEAVKPGYHMSKRHWNSVYLDGTLAPELIRELIDYSYDLVVKGLKKVDREKLG